MPPTTKPVPRSSRIGTRRPTRRPTARRRGSPPRPLPPPRTDEVGQPAVAAGIASGLDPGVQRPGGAPLAPGSARIGGQRLLDRFLDGVSLHSFAPRRYRCSDAHPPGQRVAQHPRDARHLALALVLPAVQPPDLTNLIHGDHCRIPAAQDVAGWFTWFSCRSAQRSRVAQFGRRQHGLGTRRPRLRDAAPACRALTKRISPPSPHRRSRPATRRRSWR